MPTFRFPAAPALLVALVALTALLAAPAGAAAEDELTAVVASAVAAPEPVLGSDRRQHLAYELQLVNRGSAKITVRSIQTLAGGKVVATLAGKALAAKMVPYGSGGLSNKLGAGEGAFVLMDVSFPGKAKLPRRIVHRLQLSEQPRSPANATRYLTAPTAVVQRPAVVVAPPLRGAGWVVGNGCCAALTAHRGAVLPVNGAIYVAERFAIDFVQLNSTNRLVTGPADMLSSYAFFGAPVHAAAAGKVVGVVDGIPETPAGSFPKGITAAEAGGNHVVVDIGKGRFAFYAHLQPGSIEVKIGDRVRSGQVLGMLGNSGNSDAPHLHFHIMDGPSPLASNGVPFRISQFTTAGTVTNLEELTKGAPAAIVPKPLGPHRQQLPLDLQIVNFG
ncbi:MAG TPA: M23 family metallopeptidase [Solirubrobacterales bacterium]|nr:M23 family metallopeptidase [Solirubrobacterales bacterium]